MYRKSIVLHTGFSVLPGFRNPEGLGSISTDNGRATVRSKEGKFAVPQCECRGPQVNVKVPRGILTVAEKETERGSVHCVHAHCSVASDSATP